MGKKIKVLHVLKSSVYSGAERVVITVIKRLCGEYEFAYLSTKGEIEEVLIKEQVNYYLLNHFNRKNISKVVREFRPDIIHAHDFTATVLCASLKKDCQLISHLHYDPPWVMKWNLRTFIYTSCCERIDILLLVSGEMMSSMVFIKNSNRWKAKTVVVHNPLDISAVKNQATMDPLIPSCDIIYVGRFVEQKNPQRFIHIVKKIKGKGFHDIQCIMLGDGELFEECIGLVNKLGLNENIRLLGFVNNPYQYMRKAKLLCLTSRWEGFGLVIAEANALDIPVLSTRNSGACELLGEHGWGICDEDDAFVEKMVMLLTGDVECRQLNADVRARIEELGDIENYLVTISSVYKGEMEKC